ncbi:MAG: hypothetical protein R2932_57160 [Caldilineaceae bacterium]
MPHQHTSSGALWSYFLAVAPGAGQRGKRKADLIAESDLDNLAGQFAVTSSTIRDIVAAARIEHLGPDAKSPLTISLPWPVTTPIHG